LLWKVEFEDKAAKELKKLDKNTSNKIIKYLKERVLDNTDPRQFGKELKGNLGGLWRYRVEDFRIIASIEDDKMLVLILRVAHRKNVY